MKLKIWTVLFLVLVVCVSTGMLNVVYIHTDPMVRRNERIRLQRAVLEIFDVPYEEADSGEIPRTPEDMEAVFQKSIDTQTIEDMELYRSKAGGVAFEISGSGLWGMISALIALGPDLETIRGLKILKNTETPGLGGRIAEDWFQDQFRGKRVIPELRIVAYEEAKGPNEVDAISGATQTSRAFERIVNSNIRRFYRRTGK